MKTLLVEVLDLLKDPTPGGRLTDDDDGPLLDELILGGLWGNLGWLMRTWSERRRRRRTARPAQMDVVLPRTLLVVITVDGRVPEVILQTVLHLLLVLKGGG